MKKLLLTTLILLSAFFGTAQIRIVFFNDIPTAHKEYLKGFLEKALPLWFTEPIGFFTHEKMLGVICPRTGIDNGHEYMSAIRDSDYKTIGITYSRLTYSCTEEEVYGLSLEKAGVVSAFHLGSADRIAKTIAHEMGHIYGLVHCTTKHCLMEAGGMVDVLKVIDAETDFCSKCRRIFNYNKKQ